MSQSNYTIACVQRAVTFMSEAVREEQPPSLADIAEAAGLSKYHFNRIYRLATGETVLETLTRFRLAQAANMLSEPEVSITDAAFAVGYGSSQSFAKALRRVLDTSASVVRADSERLTSAIETLTIPRTPDNHHRPDLSVEVASFAPFEAIAIRTDNTYPSLNSVYWELFDAAGGAENVRAILGMPFGGVETEDYDGLRFDCALRLENIPHTLGKRVRTQTVAGGQYLLTRHIGAYRLLPDAIDRLYLVSLSEGEIHLSDSPTLLHYLDDPETTDESDLRTDIYLRIAN